MAGSTTRRAFVLGAIAAPLLVHQTVAQTGFPSRPIRIVIGDPISTAGMTVEQRQELRERVHAAILALKARVDAEGVAR